MFPRRSRGPKTIRYDQQKCTRGPVLQSRVPQFNSGDRLQPLTGILPAQGPFLSNRSIPTDTARYGGGLGGDDHRLCRRLSLRTHETYRRDLETYIIPRFGAGRIVSARLRALTGYRDDRCGFLRVRFSVLGQLVSVRGGVVR